MNEHSDPAKDSRTSASAPGNTFSGANSTKAHLRSDAERRQVRKDLIRRFKKLRIYAGVAFGLALLGLAWYIRQNFEAVTEGGPRFAFTYVLIAVVVALSLALFFSSTKLIHHYQKLLEASEKGRPEKVSENGEDGNGPA